MKKFLALLKREILEHKNIWRMPIILIGIAVLVKLSLTVGNLTFDIDIPSELQLDDTIDSALTGVIAKSLNGMNFIIMLVMFLVAVFYALSCLYNERQDESVLFWRSLPISDTMTVASKLVIALLVIPAMVIICQVIVSVIFLGTHSLDYLSVYFVNSLPLLAKTLVWSLLPTVAWCMLCSEISKKNPFMLAFIAPILVILVDKLFLNGLLSQHLIINRLGGTDSYSFMPLVWGTVVSVVCIVLTIVKRSQRI